MTDSDLDDLDDLLHETSFSSPLRPLKDDQRKSKAKTFSADEKMVLMTDASVKRTNQEITVYDEEIMPTRYAEHGSSFSDEELPPKNETSSGASDIKFSNDVTKYKLIHVEETDNICGTVMSQGVTFCAKIRCRMNHRTKTKTMLTENHLHVLKNRDTAFGSPQVSTKNIDQDVLDRWMGMSQTLKSWQRMFRLTEKTLKTEQIATKDNLMAGEKEMKKNRDYKTPKKPKLERILKSSPPPNYTSFEPKGDSEVDASLILQHYDSAFRTLHDVVSKLHSQNQLMEKLIEEGSENFDVRFTDLEDELGSKPRHLEQAFDAPCLWGTVGELADVVSGMDTHSNNSLQESTVKNWIQTAKKETLEDIEIDVAPLKIKCNKVKTTLALVAKNLKKQADYNTQSILHLENTSVNPAPGVDFSGDIQRVEERLTILEHETANLKSSEGESIKFHNMGFHSKRDSDAWLELHVPGGSFGFIIDFHTLMEHIHHSITGVDALKQLHNVYKLKLSTLSEALSVTSFEVSVPRFLSGSGAHTVVGNDSSYFSHISNYKNWNDPSSGYKNRLKKELENFRRAHLSTIRERIATRNPLYHLATSSLTESISWVTGLINYIDNTYEEYSAGKFGTAKAWHVTTKLAMALILEVGKPREGSLNSFEAGDSSSMAKVIFYSVLKSLDTMNEIAALDYRDSPIVSTELVKFLSLNTSVEAVDRLESQSSTLKDDMKQMTKDVTTATRAAHSVGNKGDELKKVVDSLKKRIEKLEK